MKKGKIKPEHMAKLKDFGLENIGIENCTLMHYSPGEIIIEEGAAISRLGIVIDGRAKVCRTSANGKSLILCYYVSEGIIGEIELFTNNNVASTTIRTITDLHCIYIDYKICKKELQSNVVLLKKLGTFMAEKIDKSSDNFTASALHSGEERLCTYILQNLHDNIFSDILTDVSCSIGMSYRHMFRLLDKLCSEGLILKQKGGYRIINYNGLLAKSNYQEY